MDNNQKELEKSMLAFAGFLTQTWVETMAAFVGTSGEDNIKTRNRMLLAMRDAQLAQVAAVERELGISPTTADIRKWYKEQMRGNDFEVWIRERSK